MLDVATILPATLAENIKSTIVTVAEARVNEVKTSVIAQLDSLFGSCRRRHLSEVAEVGQDGSQRILTGGLTFRDLASSVQVIDGVVSIIIMLSNVFLRYAYYLTFAPHK